MRLMSREKKYLEISIVVDIIGLDSENPIIARIDAAAVVELTAWLVTPELMPFVIKTEETRFIKFIFGLWAEQDLDLMVTINILKNEVGQHGLALQRKSPLLKARPVFLFGYQRIELRIERP
jgi:hypothetical protein